ncbi:MAG: outer membrane protein assembly factor BamB family protein [Limisphaerales bacterium]
MAARWFPAGVGLAALVILAVWVRREPGATLALRVPGTDQPGGNGAGGTNANPVLLGKLIQAGGQPANLPGAWPGFRGPNRDGISPEPVQVAQEWNPSGPRELWSVEVGDGYAGAAVLNGRVYVMDYDRQTRQDALRCLSLADGREIWRYAYPVPVKRNHGMSRTVPAVTPKYVVAMGPKCHVLCVDAVTGELRWGLDLVREYGAQVPPWYTGQCPLIDNEVAILAPGGRNALMLAVDCATGKVLWQTPNPHAWKMTHSSVMPIEVAGQRMYVYCANNGVVGVSAKDGAVLWETSDWKISLATVPSPAILPGGRIFLSGGYNAGSLMLQLKPDGDRWLVQTAFRLKPEIFGATQHTPIYSNGHLYGVRPDGLFVCLDENGRVTWASDPGQKFGLGSFLMAGETLFVLNDSGLLTLMETTPSRFHRLAQAQILNGRESWGPMALAGGRLIARDLTRMVCLDVANR